VPDRSAGGADAQLAASLPCCGRGRRSENRTIAIASAAASTARPTSSPPTSRVLNGNVAAASVTRTPRALGSTAEYGLGLALGCGDTVGKRPPGEPADVVGAGSSPSVAGTTAEGTVGRIPAGSVAPRPVPVDVGVGVGDGEGECVADGFAVILMAPAAAGGAAASLEADVAVRIACLPAAVPLGMAIVAWSSSEVPLAIPPTLQVRPLAVGHTVNFGVTALLATLPLMVTVTLLAAPPAGQTQIA
jgi:hypothetical protein